MKYDIVLLNFTGNYFHNRIEVAALNRLQEIGKRILTGELPITDKIKYSFTIYSLAAVHTFFLFFFLYIRIPSMAVYSLFSTLTYLYCRRLLRKEAYPLIYYISCGEIILNTIFTTWTIGWESGFSLFLLALVAAGFYVSYTFPRHKIISPFVCGILSAVAYFGCYFMGRSTPPLHTFPDRRVFHVLYTFNSLCTFAFITIFSILFMIDVRASFSKLFEENKMLGQIAGIDALTRLYNRWSMARFLSDAFQAERPFCLVMCDIDDFKKINDTYGHECGDEVLKHIARMIQSFVPEGSYVCRWGGEELLLLLNEYTSDEAAALADKIRSTIAGTDTDFQDSRIHHTITMGVAHHHKNQTVESTIARADMKLYIGKRNGKNVVIQ